MNWDSTAQKGFSVVGTVVPDGPLWDDCRRNVDRRERRSLRGFVDFGAMVKPRANQSVGPYKGEIISVRRKAMYPIVYMYFTNRKNRTFSTWMVETIAKSRRGEHRSPALYDNRQNKRAIADLPYFADAQDDKVLCAFHPLAVNFLFKVRKVIPYSVQVDKNTFAL